MPGLKSIFFVALFFCGGTIPYSSYGQTVTTLTDTLRGGVGGISVDALGYIYVADFRETVWKIMPWGGVMSFATDIYGASGNAIDAKGNLFQAHFEGNSISKIDRSGAGVLFASEGLNGPVGIVLDAQDNLYVCNCRNNTLSKITASGEVSSFAESKLLNCPNGITIAPDSNLYVANFNDGTITKVTQMGAVSFFAELPGGGNGHITFADGHLYATSFRGNRVHRISLAGEVSLLAGSSAQGIQDGDGEAATFSTPNGIASNPAGDVLYVNDFIRDAQGNGTIPPTTVVRQIKIISLSARFKEALAQGGITSAEAIYRAYIHSPAYKTGNTESEMAQLGEHYLVNGQLEMAIAVFKLNAEAHPESWISYFGLGVAYETAGDEDLAIAAYEKSLQRNPGNPKVTERLEALGH